MQADFYNWYSSMELNGDETTRSARWMQVQAVAKTPTKSTLESLTRLTFRTKLSEYDTSAVRSMFTSDTCRAPGDPELHLLAAATLASIMKRLDATAAKVAIFVLTASCAGQRELHQPMDLVALAADALTHLAETARRRPSLEIEKPVVTQVDVKGLTEAVATPDLEGIHAGLSAMASVVNKALAAIVTRYRGFESAIQEYVRVQDEELDVLWWLHGEHCEISNSSFQEVPDSERPLLFACELAGLTRVLPGPPAVNSLLSRAGLDDKTTITIPEAVQALPVHLLAKVLPEEAIEKVSVTTTPILDAIRRRQEVDGRDAWAQTWAAVCGLGADTELPALRLAEAAYRELLLIKFG